MTCRTSSSACPSETAGWSTKRDWTCCHSEEYRSCAAVVRGRILSCSRRSRRAERSASASRRVSVCCNVRSYSEPNWSRSVVVRRLERANQTTTTITMTATIAMSTHTQVSMVPPSLNAGQPLRFLILPRRGGVDKRGIDRSDGHKSLNGLPSSLSPDAAKCLSNGLNRDVLVLFSVSRRRPQTRFARPWRASPTVDLRPLGWRDHPSGGLYSDPHGRRRWLSL